MRSLRKIVVVFCAALLFISLIYGENYEPVLGVGQFYSTPPGSVAFIPNANTREEAEIATTFYILPRDGAYKLRRQSKYWFIVNHKTSDYPEVTYLAVEIIPVYKEKTPLNAPISLRRNSGWVRPHDTNFDGDAPVQRTFETKQITDFLKFHNDKSELSMMDKDFGFKWHAVAKGSAKNSWDKRILWKPKFALESNEFRDSFLSPIAQNSVKMLNAQLIRFETTNNLASHKPLVFGFDGRAPIAAYIRIFSPDSDEFDWEFYLTFR